MNIKAIGAAILATIVAVFAIFRKGEKSATTKIKAQAEEAAREYEQAGSEAMIGGLERESEALKKPIDTTRRDHFE